MYLTKSNVSRFYCLSSFYRMLFYWPALKKWQSNFIVYPIKMFYSKSHQNVPSVGISYGYGTSLLFSCSSPLWASPLFSPSHGLHQAPPTSLPSMRTRPKSWWCYLRCLHSLHWVTAFLLNHLFIQNFRTVQCSDSPHLFVSRSGDSSSGSWTSCRGVCQKIASPNSRNVADIARPNVWNHAESESTRGNIWICLRWSL